MQVKSDCRAMYLSLTFMQQKANYTAFGFSSQRGCKEQFSSFSFQYNLQLQNKTALETTCCITMSHHISQPRADTPQGAVGMFLRDLVRCAEGPCPHAGAVSAGARQDADNYTMKQQRQGLSYQFMDAHDILTQF